VSETSLPPSAPSSIADVPSLLIVRSGESPAPPPIESLNTFKVGMITFLASEVAFFSTLIVAYLTFLGKDKVGPTPAEALSLPLVLGTTVCLLSSSATIHRAEGMLRRGARSEFLKWWAVTILLGVVFLLGTAYEWSELITRHHLTISRNLFGTTYYTLVGFHGVHVTGGIVVMLLMLGLALGNQVRSANGLGVELVSWYWHFVDAVWVAVFAVVYLIGR
jgi:cytochrome c oxidase subunit 3